MLTFGDVADLLHTWAPESLAESWDNVGLLIGSRTTEVRGILVALDVTMESIAAAERMGANLILSHHPIIFQPLRTIDGETCVAQLLRRGFGVLSAHTNLDRAKDGVNDELCRTLGFTVVSTEVDGELLGRIAELPAPMTAEELAAWIKERLSAESVQYSPAKGPIRRVALVGGGGGEYWKLAASMGCDAFITGEVKQHEWIDSINAGFPVISAGHHDTEAVVLEPLACRLRAAFPNLPVESWTAFPVHAV